MSRYSVTRVYILTAASADDARLTLDAAERVGAWHDIELEFESVRWMPDAPKSPGGWKETIRDQLLGPKESNQQPAGKKSQS